MATVTSISGTVTLSNGETVQFHADTEGTSRWGNTHRNLGDTVKITDSIAALIMVDNIEDPYTESELLNE